MALSVEGYVEVEAGLFAPGVLEDAFRRFLTTNRAVTFGRDPSAVIGKVTNIGGRGDRVLIKAALDPQPPETVLADCLRKIASGTIKGLSIEGAFSTDQAVVSSVCISPLTPVIGTGYLTTVGPSS
jgi:hypothetical protein